MWSASPIWPLHKSGDVYSMIHIASSGSIQIPELIAPSPSHPKKKAYLLSPCLAEVCVPAIYKSRSLNTPEVFSILWSNWGQRFQLVAFLLFGLIFATIHHLLGSYLSGKPVSQVVSFGRWAIPSQSLVSVLSKILSQIVKWLLASTVGVAFAQYFWSATRSYDDRRKLDAPLAAGNGNPFTISALPTWYRSPGLAFSALVMMTDFHPHFCAWFDTSCHRQWTHAPSTSPTSAWPPLL